MKQVTLTLFAFLLLMSLSAQHLHAQCMMSELPLNMRAGQAFAVVEGTVKSKTSFQVGSRIYTSYIVELSRTFKGVVGSPAVEIVDEGGLYGDRAEQVSYAIDLYPGEIGLFFLARLTHPRANDVMPDELRFQPAYGRQSFVSYNMNNGKSYDAFRTYAKRSSDLYRPIEKVCGQPSQLIAPLPTPLTTESKKSERVKGTQATITGFSPDSISAGTGEILTISGFGFGSSQGTGQVSFRNADNGGQDSIVVPGFLIQSWTDSEIRLSLPGLNRLTAGTGRIRVRSASGTVGQSERNLVVRFSNLNFNDAFGIYPTHLIADNASGGYTFSYSPNFNAIQDARNATRRAFTTWRCATGVNFDVATAASSRQCSEQDGVNLISFHVPACGSIPAGVLGATRSYWERCVNTNGQGRYYVDEIDLFYSTTPPGGWNYGPERSTGGRYDFEGTFLHEIGHGCQLGHVIDNNQLMHWNTGPNRDFRTLARRTDIDGGNAVIDRSQNLRCPQQPMRRLAAAACNIGSPLAAFAANRLRGCPPLTVTFADSSSFNPTRWAWDVNNDGTIDYTTRNPQHTYRDVGQYTVRLIVGNASGSDTIIRTNYIRVDALPTVSAGTDKVICRDSAVQLGGRPTISGGVGPFQYLWEPATGLNSTSAANPVSRATTNTTYTVRVIDANGCIVRDTVSVLINVPAVPTINKQNDILTASEGRSYQWFVNNTRINGATQRSHTALVNGSYTVQVTDSAGCRALSQPISVEVTSVAEGLEWQDITIAPNPARQFVTVSGHMLATCSVRLLDPVGRVFFGIEPGSASQRRDQEAVSIPLDGLSEGMYFIELKSGTSQIVRPFVKH